MSQSETLYAVHNPRRGVYLQTISDRRTRTISSHVTHQGLTWSECTRRGDRVAKVRVTVISEDGGGR